MKHRIVRMALPAIAMAAFAMAAAAQESALRIGVRAPEIGTLDPHRASAAHEEVPLAWMFGGLFRFPPGIADPGRIEGDLAQGWQHSPDGLVWTFRLRRGVQFHRDYGEVTADDVVYSLTRAADPKRSAFSAAFDTIEKAEAVGSYTVRITLKASVPSLMGLLSGYRGGMIVSRKADQAPGNGTRLTPVGFGPFELVERRGPREIVLKAHERYHRGKPQVARIVYRLFDAVAARDAAFSAGELDLVQGDREQRWLERARGQPGTKVDVFGAGEYCTLFLNRRVKPLDDRRVREAVARALDVPQLIDSVGADLARPGRSAVPPGYLGESAAGPALAHDVDGAKALLAEARVAPGITLKALASAGARQLGVMERVQGQLKRAGINVALDAADPDAAVGPSPAEGSALVLHCAARFPSADSYLTDFYHSTSSTGSSIRGSNFSNCRAADAEIDGARSETDPAKRDALWRTAQEKIHADICGIPLFSPQQVWVRKDALDYGVPLEGSLNPAPPISEKSLIR